MNLPNSSKLVTIIIILCNVTHTLLRMLGVLGGFKMDILNGLTVDCSLIVNPVILSTHNNIIIIH